MSRVAVPRSNPVDARASAQAWSALPRSGGRAISDVVPTVRRPPGSGPGHRVPAPASASEELAAERSAHHRDPGARTERDGVGGVGTTGDVVGRDMLMAQTHAELENVAGHLTVAVATRAGLAIGLGSTSEPGTAGTVAGPGIPGGFPAPQPHTRPLTCERVVDMSSTDPLLVPAERLTRPLPPGGVAEVLTEARAR
ncbi:hypothetical protein [uncultured Serinicoccus sp.]|uniref:hypothetical protein n=1 Tax=uncultured Serinicoccus sp. TaxID=735514 RepID=UPI002633D4F4|nr:hypothetical protein [uncultured Serinicoccus sp.]